jgi:outer membrane protein insertion porin family
MNFRGWETPSALGIAFRRITLLMLAPFLFIGPAVPRIVVASVIPRGIVTEIKIEGNTSIPEDDIRRKILSKVGREFDAHTIEVDQRALLESKWFSEVRVYYDKDEKRNGFILVFEVREMPILRSVEFRNVTVRGMLKNIVENTGLKKGARADYLKNQLAVNQIRRLYEEKGYELAEVTLLEGGKPGDTKAVFQIFEGPKCHVSGITFAGNQSIPSATLRTKISSRPHILGFGGKFHRDDIEEDARKLREYYQNLGYFEVKVSPVIREGSTVGERLVEFDVSEGTRFKVRNVEVVGNDKITTEKLKDGLILRDGKPFIDNLFQIDKKKIETQYGEIGCIDAHIEVEHKYLDEPGVVDLVYRIEEGDEYLLGHFIVKGNERTRDKVIRREGEMAGLVPGEPLDAQRIELYKQRLGNLRYFQNSPGQGGAIEVRLVNRRPHDQPYGEERKIDLDELVRARFQSPDEIDDLLPPGPSLDDPEQQPAEAAEPAAPAPRAATPAPAPAVNGFGASPPAAGPGPSDPFGAGGAFDPPADLPPVDIPIPDAVPAPDRTRTPPIGAPGEPPFIDPSLPGGNMVDVGPDRQEPFTNRSYVDLITQVQEAPTGRLMFGVGASSFQGLTGSFVLHESNFDLFALPRSWNDIVQQRAFRGAGQDFRIDLQPGTLVNRAIVSFRDPYFLDLPIGLGVSGYAFNRWYQGQFNEGRGGGRFSLGRQFGTQTYADVAFRIEDVNITGFNYPAPAEFLAIAGHTTLASLRPSLRFDNRNDPFAPNKGQYVEFAFEQMWGTFTAPKATVEGRKYFLLGSRPDGSGKRIFTVRGFFGATGRDTPSYERFFAGNFRSLRGFTYRGIGPRVLGANVGGIMEAVGSIEYQFPLLANDKLQQVVFCDFGTVESDYTFTTFRASVGTGLRVFLPPSMLGPLPLCFDLAFPVAKGPDDRTSYFNFTMGSFW